MKRYRPQAVALGYDPEQDRAPKVLAAGSGDVAEQIRAAAEEHGIPLYADPALAEILVQQDIGSEIPQQLYHAVAEILAFLYYVEDRRGKTAKWQ